MTLVVVHVIATPSPVIARNEAISIVAADYKSDATGQSDATGVEMLNNYKYNFYLLTLIKNYHYD